MIIHTNIFFHFKQDLGIGNWQIYYVGTVKTTQMYVKIVFISRLLKYVRVLINTPSMVRKKR